MKNKILIFCLLVLSVCLLVLPITSSAEEEYIIPAGTYTFNDILSTDFGAMAVPINFTIQNTTGSSSKSYKAIKTSFLSDGRFKMEYGTSLDDYWNLGNPVVAYNYSGTWFSTMQFKIITVTEDTPVPTVFYKWFLASSNLAPSRCDGSSCPATDLDIDYYCDDCGLPLTYSLRNYSVLPNPYDISHDHSDYPYAVIYDFGNKVSLYFLSNKPYITADGILTFDNSAGVGYWRYENNENENWASSLVSPTSISLKSGHVVWANTNVLDNNNNIVYEYDENFFPTPLQKIPIIVGEKVLMGETLPKIFQVMMIILLCGISCLALLLVFPLLAKSLRRFLHQ